MSVCGAKDLVSFDLGVDDLKLGREGGREGGERESDRREGEIYTFIH